MTSFDITSFFTNIPLDETINICLNGSFDKKNCVSNFDRDSFEKLLWLATKDGVTISSPLGPALANSFLCYREK